jgi:hypothetical protein
MLSSTNSTDQINGNYFLKVTCPALTKMITSKWFVKFCCCNFYYDCLLSSFMLSFFMLPFCYIFCGPVLCYLYLCLTFCNDHSCSRHGSLGPAGLPKDQEEAQEGKLWTIHVSICTYYIAHPWCLLVWKC